MALLSTNRRLSWAALCTAATLAAVLFTLTPAASADFQFGGTGSGAGQLRTPRAIAIDRSNGNLYVADQGNNRVDVFDSAGNFLRAFGWGVADGTSTELQTCTSTCFAGLQGGSTDDFSSLGRGTGAGEFSQLRDIAVDNDPASSSYHDVYTFDGYRVQKLTPGGEFLRAWGGGVVSGGAKGSGDLAAGSKTIANVITTQKAFEAGQTITGPGIPAETRIAALGPGTITLSKATTSSGTGVGISVAEGAGNVPVNEVVELVVSPLLVNFEVFVETANPSPTKAVTQTLTPSSSAVTVQAALASLPNVGAGNVTVSGPIGGPYLIEFKGTRFADTDLPRLAIGTFGSGGSTQTIIQNGASGVESCTPANAGSCTAGSPGSGEGQFDPDADRLAVGPGGTVYVASDRVASGSNTAHVNRLQLFNPSGAFSEQFEVASGSAKDLAGLAVDSTGNAYVSAGELHKYDSSGQEVATLHPSSDSGRNEGAKAVALDPAGNIFVSANGPIVEYDSAGNIQRVFYNAGLNGHVLFHSATGELFSLSGDKVLYTSFPPPGPVFAPVGTGAEAVSNLTATLRSSFNPEGKTTTVHFDYVDDASFQSGGFANPATKSTAESAPSPANFKLQEASLKAEGLLPDVTYHFRAVATNADGTVDGPEATFKTLPPIEAVSAWSTDVGTESAVLHGSVDPKGIAATGYLQYVDEASFQENGFAAATDLPDVAHGALPLDFGAGKGPSAHTVPLSSLPAGATYRFRLVAENPYGTFISPTHSFTTAALPDPPETDCANQALRGGASAGLADCRAYELVSPVDKGGGDVLAAEDPQTGAHISASLDQSTPGGAKITYSSSSSFDGAKSAPYSSQYLASRDPLAGWQTEAISPSQEGDQFTAFAQIDNAFRFFSADLSESWLRTNSEPVLAPGAPAGYPNLYRRDADGSFGTCTTTEPNVVPSEDFLRPQAASADGEHMVFQAEARLTPDSSPAKTSSGNRIRQLYECTVDGNGQHELRLVSVLPSGVAASSGSSAGIANTTIESDHGRTATLAGAISADGSRVFWTKGTSPIGGEDVGSLYIRVNASEAQSAIEAGSCSDPQAACTYPVSAGPAASFWGATPDGSNALYVEGHQGGGAMGSLYTYEIEKAIVGEAARQRIAGEVLGVLGSSEDLSRVYFLSRESIGGLGVAGEPNLYRYDAGSGGGAYAFVATLPGNLDASTTDNPSPIQAIPTKHTALVSANGESLAFASRSLALAEAVGGYDNTDRQSGLPDAEVYRYSSASGELSCISCNPGGARPAGRRLSFSAESFWVAAILPSWENSTYRRRALSEDGKRIFFTSFEALVLGDTNGKADVYEWEAPEAGSCRVSSHAFIAKAGGCLYLISSGKSTDDSEFIDASADGSDVFIRTAQSLVGQDPGQVDIYDARTGGGFSAPPAAAGECEGETCQGALVPPDDPSPASATFEGGEVPAASSCPRGKARRKGRCVSQRHRKKATHKHRRAAR